MCIRDSDDTVAELSRDDGQDRFRSITGLPLATYFSGLKLRWILQNIPGANEQAASGELLFGTVDTFLLWKLTGGVDGGIHVTDVSNASRTQLMNLRALAWDDGMLAAFEIPKSILPRIASSSEAYGAAKFPPVLGVPIAGILGDQQACLLYTSRCV